MVGPEDKEEEVEDFEPVEEEEEVFESVEEETEPEKVEEFESFDEDAPDEIDSSGFKTKGGEIPDYEPTVDEVLSFAMGKTKDPSEPVEPKVVDTSAGDSLVSLLSKTHISEEGEEVEEEDLPEEEMSEDEATAEVEEALDKLPEDPAESDEGEGDELADIFDDEGEKE